jgi:hypothetical protein
MGVKTKSAAKERMIDFIRETRSDGSIYSFTIQATREESERFVHRMRVELSRMRELVREKKRVIKEFKVLLDSIKTIKHGDGLHYSKITLKRTSGKMPYVAPEIDKIFDELAGGEQIE